MNIEHTLFYDKQKAIDLAKWLTFKNRSENIKYAVIYGSKNMWAVVKKTDAESMEIPLLDILPLDYLGMNFHDIEVIFLDNERLEQWQNIMEMFMELDHQFLQFILKEKVPVLKFLMYELAFRGKDENENFIGIEEAKKLWLK